jgi:hypothetical protein
MFVSAGSVIKKRRLPAVRIAYKGYVDRFASFERYGSYVGLRRCDVGIETPPVCFWRCLPILKFGHIDHFNQSGFAPAQRYIVAHYSVMDRVF